MKKILWMLALLVVAVLACVVVIAPALAKDYQVIRFWHRPDLPALCLEKCRRLTGGL